jgi:alkane 1-monooxygenase
LTVVSEPKQSLRANNRAENSQPVRRREREMQVSNVTERLSTVLRQFDDNLEPLVRFVGPLSYLAAVPVLHRLHPLAPILLVGILPLALLAAEALVRSRGTKPRSENTFANRLAVWLTVAAQLTLIGWGAVVSAVSDGPNIAILSLTIGLGSGVFGMLAAHEMIHSRRPLENALGLLMLSAVTYRHFRISHLSGHHRWAATLRDPATARRGETVYFFLWRSVLGQLTDAYRFERERLLHRHSWRNRVSQDLVAYMVVYSSVFAVLGGRAAVFVAAQSLVAIVVLELFNYVAHYGLVRINLPHGALEPLSDVHSWNATGEVGNWLLLDMGHHSQHHRRAPRVHDRLVPTDRLPALPGGYAGAILLALVPALWRRHMDGRVERWMANPRLDRLTNT